MPVYWNPDLEIGDTQIDCQHRELFEAVNRSLEAASQGRSALEIGELLTFLERYVREHFAAEEQLMLESGYPGYGPHKLAHEAFTLECVELGRALATKGPTPELSARLQTKVGDWLMTHIAKVDTELGRHLKQRGYTSVRASASPPY